MHFESIASFRANEDLRSYPYITNPNHIMRSLEHLQWL